ncbi:hypothetical protein Chor_011736 [Crotalus horridus]
MGPGRCRWALPAWALIWASMATAGEQPAHLFSEVFFCQKDYPLYGLAQTLDDDLVLSFDFMASSWSPRLPAFPTEGLLSMAQIEARKRVCDAVLSALTRFSDTYIQIQFPEATGQALSGVGSQESTPGDSLGRFPPPGIPEVEIFTLQPLVLGQPNVLVCSVRNIFPPVARIRWAHQDQELTQGVFSTQTYPVQVLDFQIFSYLEVIPQADDIYSCTVKGLGGKFDSKAFWVPKDPIASKLLENALCGLAVAVGGVFFILGVVLLALSFRARHAD